jgi:hypothetical protein
MSSHVKAGVDIYFAGSIRGGRSDAELYGRLIEYLRRFGNVLTEHIGSESLGEDGEEGFTDTQVYLRDLQWLRESDVLVAEVTTPSLGVGYEIAKAEERGIPVLCLYRDQPGKHLSAMIAGNEGLSILTYRSWEDLSKRIDEAFLSLGIRPLAATGPPSPPASPS